MTTKKQKEIDEKLGKKILDEMIAMPTDELRKLAMTEPPNYREAKCCKTCKWKKSIPWENDVLCTKHQAEFCSDMICDDYESDTEKGGE